ncbi:tetratricopeptide repeat protein [Streptomyces sp. NPDC097617]|uniref:tetratricopeptide repeat protein n=1 Tax=Streptomyces sp. NPDC097617 TaxID=3366091 RepID=UPI0038267BD3
MGLGKTVLMDHIAAETERVLGPEHPDTLTARGNLAGAYGQAGRIDDAITSETQNVKDLERVLGPEHPDTLTARANLAASYQRAGRVAEAVVLLAQVVSDRQRVLGPRHPATVSAQGGLEIMNAFVRGRGRVTNGP